MTEQHERLLTYDEVGRRLGLGRTALWALVRDGKFPEPLRIGRARRWRECDVDRWIADLASEKARDKGGEDGAAA